jgi:hypothetical protein
MKVILFALSSFRGARALARANPESRAAIKRLDSGSTRRRVSRNDGDNMKVILFGATGMVGQGVLRECLLDASVERVLAVAREGYAKPVLESEDINAV